MKSVKIHLNSNEDLLLFLENFGKEYNSNGFILGVVGNLSQASFKCPGKNSATLLVGNLEIISLNGTISPSGPHIHLSISDNSCKVWGGHLEKGTIILKGVDLLIGITNQEYLNFNLNQTNKNKLIDNHRVKIYVLKGCPWSNRAIRILNSYNFDYFKKTIESDIEYNQIYSLSNSKTFPQIFIDDKFIGGYESLSELHKKGELKKI